MNKIGFLDRKKVIFLVFAFSLGVLSMPLTSEWHIFSTSKIPIASKCIVIDAGHGGPDGGAVNKSGLIEKEVTLKIAQYLKDYLQEAGALVIMTREQDKDLSNGGSSARRKAEDLMRRVRITEDKSADLFLSIHLNAIPSTRWSGAQTFYNPVREENQKVATSIQTEIKRTLENTNRLPAKRSDVYVLREPKVPTTLVEVGFISHPQESVLLSDEKYQRKLAAAIYYGVARYFSTNTLK